ncbi:phosphodiester glycosidase family protein [Planotetraspora phitsanulokensis]|nr:phosphodiester glycosidase family protein [Planotetraspora phitsanulokensis]
MRRHLIVGTATVALTTITLSAFASANSPLPGPRYALRLLPEIPGLPDLPAAPPPPPAARPATSLPSTGFPLGSAKAPKVVTERVAPGIDYFTLTQGTPTDGYSVSVVVRGKDALSEKTASAQALAVEESGFQPSIVKFTRPAVADYPAADFWMVRVGAWPLGQQAEAARVVKRLKKDGITAKVDFGGDDGFQTGGPWTVRVLTVDPRSFQGVFRSSLGAGVAARETVSAMASSAGAIAAVNGGFFDIHTLKDFSGDPTGISVVGGDLLSEAVPGRTALVLAGRRARVTELSSSVVALSADGAKLEVGGLNRVARPDELVMYTEELGRATPSGNGEEVVLDSSGKVLRSRGPGAPVAHGTRVLHGRGTAADWLRAHAAKGMTVDVTAKVTDLRTGNVVPLTPETSIIGGGIGLVRDGRTSITAATDGMANVNMIVRRHPRTLAGVTASGGLVIAVVDGRAPGTTVGASFFESAELMRWLGARDAISLDGGGSSTMVVDGKVVNHPSDGAERGVGDALLIIGK